MVKKEEENQTTRMLLMRGPSEVLFFKEDEGDSHERMRMMTIVCLSHTHQT